MNMTRVVQSASGASRPRRPAFDRRAPLGSVSRYVIVKTSGETEAQQHLADRPLPSPVPGERHGPRGAPDAAGRPAVPTQCPRLSV